ncbi:MAG: cytochrome c nitrite reductase small subunit [Deltaproteobacteria bacterium]
MTRGNASRGWLSRSLVPAAGGHPLPWILAVLLGVAAGVGAYTFSYAKGLSYFGTDPKACTNCHIMEPEYAGWQKGSHHDVAVCIDCHLPHAFVSKYLTKAENGYRHGKLFTTQTFEEPITIKPAGLAVLQSNCERCHADLVQDIVGSASGPSAETDRPACIHCHWTVGHGERAGLGGPLSASELQEQLGQDSMPTGK